jgi:hypothetical protein
MYRTIAQSLVSGSSQAFDIDLNCVHMAHSRLGIGKCVHSTVVGCRDLIRDLIRPTSAIGVARPDHDG